MALAAGPPSLLALPLRQLLLGHRACQPLTRLLLLVGLQQLLGGAHGRHAHGQALRAALEPAAVEVEAHEVRRGAQQLRGGVEEEVRAQGLFMAALEAEGVVGEQLGGGGVQLL